ncbi:MAG: single-stranded DNA-binding protein [Spirochaetales bacterium]|nr:single-stranded DNA-binding protein [Spirochaetales bacterium]
MNKAQLIIEATLKMSQAVSGLDFIEEITHIYNPLVYAWDAHRVYIERFAGNRKKVIFLGMNPGPWGMAQTGVPFGEISAVKDWLKIEEEVSRPAKEHPKRPVEGFLCSRSEISGKRLWSLIENRFGNPEKFFQEHYVANYCPVSFMTETGKNFTPDKLPKEQQKALFDVCDIHLREIAEILEAEWLIGVGKFAEKRINEALKKQIESSKIKSGTIIHPSPASPAANKGWAEAVIIKMAEYGLWT